MVLQSSGPISLDDVQNEFGGVNPVSINEYYGVDFGVPTSGTISLNNFYGKEGPIPGSLFSWGSGTYGRLGNNATTTRSTPITTFAGGNNWKRVSVSATGSTYAIKSDGTLWVWGYNYSGTLATNNTGNRLTPVTTFAGGTNWKQVSGAGFYAAAIKSDGTLWTWGNGQNRQLGTNDTNNRLTPVTTFAGGTTWRQVSCGNAMIAAIKTDGTLWTWGYGGYGQLGTNDTITRPTPVTTFAGGNNWKQVSAGCAAIKTDGTLWVWGSGIVGRLGTNDTIRKLTPVTTFAGGNNWEQVSFGVNLSAAVKTDGTLWTWGNGFSGALGNNATTNRSTPVTTFAGGNNWKQVSCGQNHIAAVKADGTLWTWGWTSDARLGTNDSISRSTPVTTFAGGNDWKEVNIGNQTTAAIR